MELDEAEKYFWSQTWRSPPKRPLAARPFRQRAEKKIMSNTEKASSRQPDVVCRRCSSSSWTLGLESGTRSHQLSTSDICYMLWRYNFKAVSYEHMPLVFFTCTKYSPCLGFLLSHNFLPLDLLPLWNPPHLGECRWTPRLPPPPTQDRAPSPRSAPSAFLPVSICKCIVEARSEIKSEEKNISTSHSAIEAHEKATLVRKNKLLLSEVKENTENLSAEVGFEPTYRRDNDHVSISLFRPFRWSPGSLVPLPRKHQQPVLRPNFKHRSSMLNTILLHHSR